MRRIASLLIVLGLITMAYPHFKSMYASYQETKLLERWNNESEVAQASFLNLEQVFQHQEDPIEKDAPTQENLLGILTIDKIDLEIPILEGADSDNLRIAAGKLAGTDPLDSKFGNTAIAAHRSYTYGHQFNRLDELETGDEIVIETKRGTYTYTVYDKLVVDPTDVTVLQRNDNERIITLITCEPIRTATHRLIIQAK